MAHLLQIELLIRRIPFGRVYAIRRDIERQCLGLIRDNNTPTIVDVVPNSLSARHGLPPKVKHNESLLHDNQVILPFLLSSRRNRVMGYRSLSGYLPKSTDGH